MGHVTLNPRRHGNSKLTLLDIAIFFFFFGVALFLLLVFTSLGDSLAASGRRTLDRSDSGRRRDRMLSILEDYDSETSATIEMCDVQMTNWLPQWYGEGFGVCLVPNQLGYRAPVPWPESLHKIWRGNMLYNGLVDWKGHQGSVKEEGNHFVFPGGGSMFPAGVEKYIEKLGQFIPLKGGVLRTALDMGCGVADFGGYLLSKNITTLSFARKDSQKAIQFALERGIPAFIAMLGTHRLPFPAYSFDVVHCSRCLIPFSTHNGTYFIEVDRLLRPGGYLVISGPPVQWVKHEKEWTDLQSVAHAMCYDLIAVEDNIAIWKKPLSSKYLPNENGFGIENCVDSDDPSEAWHFKLKKCVSKDALGRKLATGSIARWPERLVKPSARVSQLRSGVDVFEADARRWSRRVAYYKKLQKTRFELKGVKRETLQIRNVMDMNAFLGGYATALSNDPVWVMNVVPPKKPLTLGVIYDRGLIGLYHDWCEPFPTYPRTYDLIHVAGINSLVRDPATGNTRCSVVDLMVEMDRILRPGGSVIIREAADNMYKVARIAKAVRWMVEIHEPEPESRGKEKILMATKTLSAVPDSNFQSDE